MNKKLMIVFLVVAMSLTIFAGCSNAELGFYELNKEVTEIGVYQVDSTIDFTMDLPDEYMGGTDMPAVVGDILKGTTLKMSGVADNNNMDMDVNIKLIFGNKTIDMGNYIMKQGVMYMPVAGIKDVVAVFGTAKEVKEFAKAVGDAKYITIDMDKDIDGMSSLLKDPQKLYEDMFNLSDTFVKDSYKDFSLGKNAITQVGSKYVLEMSATDVVNAAFDFATYTVKNSEKVRPSVIGFFKSDFAKIIYAGVMSDAEVAEMIGEVNKFFDVLNTAEGYEDAMTVINDAKADMPDMNVMLNGSKIKYTLGKTSNGYTSNTDMILNLYNPDSKALMFGFSIKENSTYVKKASVNVAAPVGATVALADIIPDRTSVYITVSDNSGFYMKTRGLQSSSGSFDIASYNIDGRIYLPLRQVSELFSEQVNWDSKTGQITVITTDGEKIVMSGIVKNNRTYVKIRDFEKLGYQVDWYSTDKVVTIDK